MTKPGRVSRIRQKNVINYAQLCPSTRGLSATAELLVLMVALVLLVNVSTRTAVVTERGIVMQAEAAGGANAPAYWAPASLIRPTPKKTPVA